MGDLFSDGTRSEESFPRFGHSTFYALEQRSGLEWDAMRDLVEVWWQRSPEECRMDIKGRIQSGDDEQFRSAFVELYVSELLLRAGCQLIGHPDLGTGTNRPDFLATNSRGKQFVVEVTTSASPVATRGEQKRLDVLLDGINKLTISKFFLRLEVVSVGSRDVSTIRLRSDLQGWLETLDHSKVLDQIAKHRMVPLDEDSFSFVWKDSGWEINFSPWPKSPEFFDKPSRTVGSFGPSRASAVNDTDAIRGRLKDKANRYGEFALPYIIAFETQNWIDPDYSAETSLYGDDQITIRMASDGTEVTERSLKPNGFWRIRSGFSNQQVSAVIMLNNISPWAFASGTPTLWHHPEPTFPIDTFSSILGSYHLTPTGSMVKSEPSTSQHAYFNIPTSWPSPETSSMET